MGGKRRAASPSVRQTVETLRANRQLSSFERWQRIGDIVSKHLQQNGTLLNTQSGHFLFDHSMRRTFPLIEKPGIGLQSLILDRYGINAAEHGFKWVLNKLRAEAYLKGKQAQVRRLAHYDPTTGILLISSFDGSLYRLVS